MNIYDLGYTKDFEDYRIKNSLSDFEVGRIITEHKERYVVLTCNGEFEAEIIGNMRFTAKNREDFPAVGDWVAISVFDTESAIIHKILPRLSTIKRQAVGHYGEVQIIATNIDYAFLMQAIDRDFSINRFERFLTICFAAKVQPIIILTKIDLIDKKRIAELTESIKQRIKDIPVYAISNETHYGYYALTKTMSKGKTYCMLGSSGVGKSTLLNNLSGENVMKTGEISESSNKGRHVSSHRELIVLENGGILIDNPGMREVGITDSSYGLETTFDVIYSLAEECKFKDCNHTNDMGCAVLKAVKNGVIEKSTYENYLKLEKEKEHFESTVAEKHKKDKDFSKMVKNYKKNKKMNKY